MRGGRLGVAGGVESGVVPSVSGPLLCCLGYETCCVFPSVSEHVVGASVGAAVGVGAAASAQVGAAVGVAVVAAVGAALGVAVGAAAGAAVIAAVARVHVCGDVLLPQRR